MDDFGLMYYNARWYDPALGRMAQADTIVPGGVQGYDRYAYVNNDPIRYTDPTGHYLCEGVDACEHSTTIESQELARRRQHDKPPRWQVLSGHRIDEEEGSGPIVTHQTAVDGSDTDGPDWRLYIAGGLEIEAGALTMVLGLLTVSTVFAGEHAVGIAGAPATGGLSEWMAIAHTPAVLGLGGGITAVGIGFAKHGYSNVLNSGVPTWVWQQVSSPFNH
jgi:RHS repeat-associated protein